MDIFEFFKNKQISNISTYDDDVYKLVDEGILLEDQNIFLKWGKLSNNLIKKVNGNKIVQGDRITYYWGEHYILNGLKLSLSTMYWRYYNIKFFKRFYEVGFWAVGDKISEKYLKLISNHLEAIFGLPIKNETTDSDVSIIWQINDVKISLYFFEQHVYKLHFQIEKCK